MDSIRRVLTLLLFAACAVGCSTGSKQPDSADGQNQSVEVRGDGDQGDVVFLPVPVTDVTYINNGPVSLEVNLNRRDLRLSWKGQVRTSIALNELKIGLVTTIDPKRNYAPTLLKKVPIDDLQWLVINDVKWAPHPVLSLDDVGLVVEPGGVTLAIEATDTRGDITPQWQLHIDPIADAGFRFKLAMTPTAATEPMENPQSEPSVVLLGVSALRQPKDRFYGLGGWLDGPEHGGKRRAMQREFNDKLADGENGARATVPWVIGTSGWGWYLQTERPGLMDIAKADADRVSAMFHTSSLTWWMTAAEHPLTLQGALSQWTLPPKLPPRWALGPMMARREARDAKQLVQDAKSARAAQLPITTMVIERQYAFAHGDRKPVEPGFAEPETWVQQLRDLDFMPLIWATPTMEQGATTLAQFTSAGWLVNVSQIAAQFLTHGLPVDFTHPQAVAAWLQELSPHEQWGIQGWRMTGGDEILVGLYHLRTPHGFADGRSEKELHRLYGTLYHQRLVAGLGDSGGLFIGRPFTLADRAYLDLFEVGAVDSSTLPHKVCAQSPCERKEVGGFPAALAAALGLACSGFPSVLTEVGGQRGGRVTKTLMRRWLAQASLSPALLLGGEKQSFPWDDDTYVGAYGTSKFDQDLLQRAKQYLTLRARLTPYIYSYLSHASKGQVGLMRPLGLAEPELISQLAGEPDISAVIDSMYMLGDSLLVAPMVSAGSSRRVALPSGQWYDFWTRKALKGAPVAQVRDLDMTTLDIGVWVRAGALIAMLDESETLLPDKQPPLAEALTIQVVPGGASTLILADNTRLEQRPAGKAIEVQLTPGERYSAGWTLHVWTSNAPKAVVLDGVPIEQVADAKVGGACLACWWFDSSSATAQIRVAPGAHTITALLDTP